MTGTALAPVDYVVQREQALAQIRDIDERDEQQIEAILGGELVEEYVYSFPKDGKTIFGLSFAGYREWASWRGNFTMDQPVVEELPDEFRVMVQVHDLDRNVSIWAGTHQPKMQTFRDKNRKPERDAYAFEKAISKAQRNAYKNLMPMTMVQAAIKKLKGLAPGEALQQGARGEAQQGLKQGPQRAIQGSQGKNGSKGTSELPDGSPKDLGQLFKWSFDSFGYYQATVFEILGVKNVKEIVDLKAAWEKVKKHATDQAPTQEETVPTEEPSQVEPDPDAEPNYPATGTELAEWARSTWKLGQDQVEELLGERVQVIQDLPAAWTELQGIMAGRGEGG